MVESGGIYSVRNAFATRLQQKYLKNIGHFSVIDTGECLFFMQILLQRLCCPFPVFCMKKVFTIGTRFVPVFIIRQELICNRNFSDSIFCFTVNHIEILFFQMNVFFLQIKKFGNTCAIIDFARDGYERANIKDSPVL